jgi:tetratricopeptide (TPR) repeat protein
MRRSYARLLAGVAWLVVCATPVSAAPPSSAASLADKYQLTDPDAIGHFQAGNAAYKAGVDKHRPRANRDRDLESAIAEYTAGQAIQDRPVFDFNLGLAYKALGRTDEAIDHLQRFLDRADETVSAEARADAEKKLAALDPAGKHRAELAKRRVAPPPPVPAPAPNVAPVADVERTPIAPRAPAPVTPSPVSAPGLATTETMTPRSSVHWTRVGGWGLTGAGILGAGVTAWLVIDAQSLDDQANDAQANHSVSERQALADRADSRRRSALVVGIGSGALVVSGALILILSSGHEPAPTRTGWNLRITGHGVAVAGRF